MSTDYREIIKEVIIDDENFLRATFSGRQRQATLEWKRVTLRPVELKGQRNIQIAYYDSEKCITKNYRDGIFRDNLDALLQLPFKNIQVASATGAIHVNVSKSGKPLIHRTYAADPIRSAELSHNRQKDFLIPEGKPDAYLQAIGFMTGDGRVKAEQQKKFKQINEFLKLLQQTGEIEKIEKPVLQIVDYGCGNAYLTFAAYHYLNNIVGRATHMVGVDVRGEPLAKHVQTVQSLGWSGLTFAESSIVDFVPSQAPDITLALHACDTATDEALAQGIKTESKLIISVPCCHHHLQEQIRRNAPSELFRPVLRHGILAERLGDILTDSFRALILRIMGYQTEVLQFISSEHTAKNVMIRAVRLHTVAPAAFIEEYKQMKAYWNVTPWLETLLGEPFYCHLG